MVEKRAVQRNLIDKDGNARVVYIDLDTFKEIPFHKVRDYKIFNANNQMVEQVENLDDPNSSVVKTETISRYPDYLMKASRYGGGRQSTNIEDVRRDRIGARDPQVTIEGVPTQHTPTTDRMVKGMEHPATVDPNTPGKSYQGNSPSRPDNYAYGGPQGNFDTSPKGLSSTFPGRPDGQVPDMATRQQDYFGSVPDDTYAGYEGYPSAGSFAGTPAEQTMQEKQADYFGSVPDRNWQGNIDQAAKNKAAGDTPSTPSAVGLSGFNPGNHIAETPTVSESINQAARAPGNIDDTNDTPAAAAARGLVSRTPEEIDAMANTFAGELAGSSLRGLIAGDENARREYANMITSAENRAAVKGFEKTFSPSQYNSNMKSKLSTTNNNYSKFGPALRSAAEDYYAGKLKPDNYGVTNYYSPTGLAAEGLKTPAWDKDLTNTADAGLHHFGGLPEWDAQSIKDYSGGTFGTGPNHSKNFSTPAERGPGPGMGAGDSRSYGDSPSESIGRSGGSSYGGREGNTSGPGMGLGGRSTSSGSSHSTSSGGLGGGFNGPGGNSSKSGGTSDKSQGPSGGGYGGWGGPH